MKSISFVMGHEGAILAVGLPPCNSKRQIFQQKSKKLLDLDLDVHAGRQVELHQSINRLIGRVDDVHETLMRADLKLIAARLVDVRRTKDVEALDARRKRNRTTNHSAGALGGVNDLQSGLVDELIVVGLEADANALRLHFDFLEKRTVKEQEGAEYNSAPSSDQVKLPKKFDYSMTAATTPAPTV